MSLHPLGLLRVVRSRPAAAVVVGVTDGLLAAALYLIGWGRAFSFDASRTVGQFVTAESLGGVFRQDRFNNHPLFSFMEHVVYAVTGSADERLLRVLPIACGAVAVGIVAGAVARRFGPVAGHVAGLTLAVNAMAVRQFREVRGYALVTLAVVIATVALFRLLRQRRPGWIVLYVGALAVAVGTHLFAAGILVVHALVVVGSRPRRVWPWVGPWMAALGVGLLVQWPALVDGLRTPPQNIFAPTFPLRLAANLLGGPAVPGTLVLVACGWVVLRTRSWLPWVMAGTGAMVVVLWLAGPSWLDSRFFIWLAPAVAVAAGAGVAARPKLAWLAAACVAAQVIVLVPGLAGSEVPNRIAAGFASGAQADGAAVCALGRTRAGLLAYVDVPVRWEASELHDCDVAVEAAGPKPQPLLGAACDRFAYVLTLPARHPGAVFADRPLPLVREHVAEAGPDAAGWQPTAASPLCRGA